MTRAERRFNQKRKWLSRARKMYNTWKSRYILYYMRSGNLGLHQYSTFQDFLDNNKLLKNTTTPCSDPFDDKEGWRHDKREVKAKNRKIRHNELYYILEDIDVSEDEL